MYKEEKVDDKSSTDVLAINKVLLDWIKIYNQIDPLMIEDKLNNKLMVFLLLFKTIKYTNIKRLIIEKKVASNSIIFNYFF
jgi:hypothetical protein